MPVRFEDLVGRSVVIWGAGREGRAAHTELTTRGIASVLAVTDGRPTAEDLAALVVTGPAAVACLESAEVVVRSPGIPHTSAQSLQLKALRIPVTSLTDLWLNDNAGRAIAVTGTKGKSTTSALIQHLLGGVGVTAALVGNGGTPVTAGDQASAQVAVVEVSSYQAADLTVSPRVAVITSLYPEHLLWHGSFEQYVADKLNLVAHHPGTVIIPDAADEIGRLVAARTGPDTRVRTPSEIGLTVTETGIEWRGVGELPLAKVPLHGLHNLTNIALGLAAGCAFVDPTSGDKVRMLESVSTFAPLTHRLETVPSYDGRAWVDDSLATAPEAVVAALETYPRARVTLIIGGADRGLSFTPLTSYLIQREPPATVIAVGPAGARIAREAAESGIALRLAPDFAGALAWATEDRTGSDVVLLSPGAPSFDEFASYEERSAAFRAAASSAGQGV